MRKLQLDEWEKEYVWGSIERYDQKNTMTRRKYADEEMAVKLDSLSSPATFIEKPGFTQKDFALRWAPRYFHGLIAELNNSKPNPSSLSKEIAKVTAQSSEALSYPLKIAEKSKIEIGDPEMLTRDIKNAAIYFGANLVGICKLDQRWVYSHSCEKEIDGNNTFSYKQQEIPEEYQNVIVLGFKVDYDMLKYVTTLIGGAAHDISSNNMVVTTALVTRFIQLLGFNAIDCNIDDVVITVPLAMQAGLGQIGRHGLLITPEFGPRVRLSAVITNLPLVADLPIDFGVTEFCEKCKKCAKLCPSNSISHGNRTIQPINISNSPGGFKWPQNGETCLLRAARNKYPCSTCISVCPYNKPDTWFHRLVRWFTDHMRWADSFYVKMDDLFGYGKPKKADNFWSTWHPR